MIIPVPKNSESCPATTSATLYKAALRPREFPAGDEPTVGLGHKSDLSTQQVTPERADAQRRLRVPSSPEGSPALVARTQNGGGDDQQSGYASGAFRRRQLHVVARRLVALL